MQNHFFSSHLSLYSKGINSSNRELSGDYLNQNVPRLFLRTAVENMHQHNGPDWCARTDTHRLNSCFVQRTHKWDKHICLQFNRLVDIHWWTNYYKMTQETDRRWLRAKTVPDPPQNQQLRCRSGPGSSAVCEFRALLLWFSPGSWMHLTSKPVGKKTNKMHSDIPHQDLLFYWLYLESVLIIFSAL